MATEHDRHSLHGRRILIVEDDYLLAIDLEQQFTARGVEILGPVPTVERALELIEATPVLDAAILDVNLRGAWSFPVADALVARDVPFLFATGYGEDVLPARHRQAIRCEKPAQFRDLTHALETLIGGWRSKTQA